MNDDLEFLISQYADGTLGELESRALEARLIDDAEARAELEKHRRVIGLLREMPAPAEMAWDRLSARIGSAVAKQPEPGHRPASYRLFAGRFAWAAIGLAATFLIAGGLALRMFLGTAAPSPAPPRNVPLAMQHLLRVTGPRAEVAAGPAMAEVTIGPGKGAVASAGSNADDNLPRPSVLVAGTFVATDDTSAQMPF